MTSRADMAELADLLPHDTARRWAWLARIPRPHRRTHGLAAIPERYRLQFLLLARDAMPGRPPGEVMAVADKLASGTKLPARLLADPHPEPLDRWLKEHAGDIRDCLDHLVAAWPA